jgi:hypothetical protein
VIILTTTKSLEVVLDAAPAAEFPWTASYVDINTPSTFTPDASDGDTNGTTPVAMVAAPSAGKRQVKALSVTNLSPAAQVVTVQINNGSTTRPVCPPVTLPPGFGLLYIDTRGFYVVDATGAILDTGTTGPQGPQGIQGNPSTVPGPVGPQGPAFWNKGTAVLDFGAFPGGAEAATVITGLTGIAAGSFVYAYFADDTTADHTAADHKYAAQLVGLSTGAIVAGVGFTVWGRCLDAMQGTFTVRYLWG